MNTQPNDAIADVLGHLHIHPASLVQQSAISYALDEAVPGQRQLVVLATTADTPILQEFVGDVQTIHAMTVLLGPLSAHNAAALRRQIDWLNPRVFGLATSAGFGDRLGLATPGHLQAVRAAGGHIAPIPAQQSIREMTRTGRSPQQVMDDAMWGIFAEGWRDGFGADADHLKTPEDIDSCLAAGYTFYTFDPGEHVDNDADTAAPAALRAAFDALPWEQLHDSPDALSARYLTRTWEFEGHTILFDNEGHIAPFDDEVIVRAAVKYGRAIAYVARMYQHLAESAAGRPWEVEISVDETETPTTHAEHIYFVTELRRLGVQWVSLAPRYIGRFEKGVDYISDLDAFTADFAIHAAIARALGPYKLSLHSGSDKFSVYQIAVRETQGLVHLKTAGTSYLEALRTVGQIEPDLLRAIYVFARERYEVDRASYHVSARLDRAPAPETIDDATAHALLEQFDAREILHVTFGSVLTYTTADGNKPFYTQIMALLQTHPDAYAANLKAHFLRHLQPFVPYSRSV